MYLQISFPYINVMIIKHKYRFSHNIGGKGSVKHARARGQTDAEARYTEPFPQYYGENITYLMLHVVLQKVMKLLASDLQSYFDHLVIHFSLAHEGGQLPLQLLNFT